jgi:hypothetical protein
VRSLGAFASLAAVLAALAGGGCADSGVEVAPEGFVLPATLEEALPLAEAVAHDWDGDAYVFCLGGGYTFTDTTGRSRNHSYRFYSRRLERRLDVHLFEGTPWGEDESKWPPPTPLSAVDVQVTSDEAVRVAVATAADLRLDVSDDLSARLFSFPVWPENFSGLDGATDSVAWRIDFLEMRWFPGMEDTVAYSQARIYVHVETGDTLGIEVSDPPIVYPGR